MLKEPIKTDDIIALKLVSGEEVIAKVVTNDETMLTVNKPLTLIHTPKGVAMSQYILMQDMTVPVSIDKEKVIVITKANSNRKLPHGAVYHRPRRPRGHFLR